MDDNPFCGGCCDGEGSRVGVCVGSSFASPESPTFDNASVLLYSGADNCLWSGVCCVFGGVVFIAPLASTVAPTAAPVVASWFSGLPKLASGVASTRLVSFAIGSISYTFCRIQYIRYATDRSITAISNTRATRRYTLSVVGAGVVVDVGGMGTCSAGGGGDGGMFSVGVLFAFGEVPDRLDGFGRALVASASSLSLSSPSSFALSLPSPTSSSSSLGTSAYKLVSIELDEGIGVPSSVVVSNKDMRYGKSASTV